MKRAICIMLGLALLSVAWAQDKPETKPTAPDKKPAAAGELTDPVEILKKTDAACKAVKAVQYEAAVEPLGAAKGQLTKFEGSYLFSGFAYGGPEKSRMEVRLSTSDSDEVRHLTGGSDGENYYLIDHKAKKAYEDMDPQVMGSNARALQGGMMIEFVVDDPFGHEISGKSQTLKGSETIAGEDCYVIVVVYEHPQAPQATWYISKKDFLPRCRLDEGKTADGREWGMRKTLSKLVADPKLSADAFKLKLPEGYTKTDDFAP